MKLSSLLDEKRSVDSEDEVKVNPSSFDNMNVEDGFVEEVNRYESD